MVNKPEHESVLRPHRVKSQRTRENAALVGVSVSTTCTSLPLQLAGFRAQLLCFSLTRAERERAKSREQRFFERQDMESASIIRTKILMLNVVCEKWKKALGGQQERILGQINLVGSIFEHWSAIDSRKAKPQRPQGPLVPELIPVSVA